MTPASRRQQCFAWIAVLALLLAALAPSLSSLVSRTSSPSSLQSFIQPVSPQRSAAAGAAGRYAMMDQICSVHGATVDNDSVVYGGHDGRQGPGDGMVHFGHCAFCSTPGPVVGLPPSAVQPAALPAGTALRPRLFLRASYPLAIWTASQPRGPPVFS